MADPGRVEADLSVGDFRQMLRLMSEESGFGFTEAQIKGFLGLTLGVAE